MIKRERKLFLKTFFNNFFNICHFITEDDTTAIDADDNDVTASQQQTRSSVTPPTVSIASSPKGRVVNMH